MTTNGSGGKIIDRLRKLLNLAERGGTPEEAATAAAMAQRLLLEHNLSMADVTPEAARASQPWVGYEDATVGMAPPRARGKHHIDWLGRLAGGVARAFLCDAVLLRGGRVCFVGRPENLEAVKFVYPWVADQILTMSRTAASTSDDPNAALSRGAWLRVFRLHAGGVVSQRLREQREAFARQSAATTALVLASDAGVRAAVARRFPSLKKGRTTSVSSRFGGAAHEGREAGARVQINRSLPEGKGR